MTGPGHDLIVRVAAEIGVEIVGRPDGGENGAAFVRDHGGRDLVLKATPWLEAAPDWTRGAALARGLARTGYPAPRRIDIGTAPGAGATWSLQDRLPGTVPERTTAAHVRQLLALAERHRGRAPQPDPGWPGAVVDDAAAAAARLAAGPTVGRPWGDEIAERLPHLANEQVVIGRHDDVVHIDFHHRNFLADDERVTGVFDWEAARPGDWRFDVATLAFWACLAGDEMAPAARIAALDHAAAACPAPVLALYALCLSARTLDFYARRRPALVGPTADAIAANVAAWWR